MDINFSLIWDALPLLLAGAGITIEITALSVGFGLLIGMTVGIARLASIKPVRYFANCYVDFIRGTPLLVQIFLVYFALPKIMNSNKWSGRAMAKSVISISLSLSMMIDREPLTNVCGGSQPLPWENTIRP